MITHITDKLLASAVDASTLIFLESEWAGIGAHGHGTWQFRWYVSVR